MRMRFLGVSGDDGEDDLGDRSRDTELNFRPVGARFAIFENGPEMPFQEGLIAWHEESCYAWFRDHFNHVAIRIDCNPKGEYCTGGRSPWREHRLNDVRSQLAGFGVAEERRRSPGPGVQGKSEKGFRLNAESIVDDRFEFPPHNLVAGGIIRSLVGSLYGKHLADPSGAVRGDKEGGGPRGATVEDLRPDDVKLFAGKAAEPGLRQEQAANLFFLRSWPGD